MPNWCMNTMTIEGETSKIKELAQKIEDNDALLETLRPIGEWDYDTAVSEWGTKWDIPASEAEMEVWENDDSTSRIEFVFDSAWAPPVTALETFLSKNPDLTGSIQYFEPGVGFVGRFEEGIDEQYECCPDSWEDLPEEIVEWWQLAEYYYDEDDEEDD